MRVEQFSFEDNYACNSNSRKQQTHFQPRRDIHSMLKTIRTEIEISRNRNTIHLNKIDMQVVE